MSMIDISRSHSLNPDEVSSRAETFAQHLDKNYQISYFWDKGKLHLERDGVHGSVEIGNEEIHVHIVLNRALKPFGKIIIKRINRYFDEHISSV